jgi:hypothetical protein
VRPSAAGEGFNAVDFLQKVGKSKPVAGIVEALLNGSTLRVTLLPDLTPVRRAARCAHGRPEQPRPRRGRAVCSCGVSPLETRVAW